MAHPAVSSNNTTRIRKAWVIDLLPRLAAFLPPITGYAEDWRKHHKEKVIAVWAGAVG
jgi:hypothetical protein